MVFIASYRTDTDEEDRIARIDGNELAFAGMTEAERISLRSDGRDRPLINLANLPPMPKLRQLTCPFEITLDSLHRLCEVAQLDAISFFLIIEDAGEYVIPAPCQWASLDVYCHGRGQFYLDVRAYRGHVHVRSNHKNTIRYVRADRLHLLAGHCDVLHVEEIIEHPYQASAIIGRVLQSGPQKRIYADPEAYIAAGGHVIQAFRPPKRP